MFNGNNYTKEWEEEAEKRGLLNLKSTPDALSYYDREENIKLFEKFKIYTAAEIRAREEILLENYSKVLNIEALTMIDMVGKQILPAVFAYSSDLAEGIVHKKACGVSVKAESDVLKKITNLSDAAYDALNRLSDTVVEAKGVCDFKAAAFFYRRSEEHTSELQSQR